MSSYPRSARTAPTLLETWDLRWPERQLLFWSAVCVGLGFLMILASDQNAGHRLEPAFFRPLAVYLVSLVVMHLTLVLARFQGDQILLGAVAFLAGFGLLAQSRMGVFASTDVMTPSLYLFPVGVFLMLAVCIGSMRGRFELYSGGQWLWGAVSLALVALLLVLGQRFRGAVYGTGLVTPTELLKVTVVLFMASYIDRCSRGLGQWGAPGSLARALVPLVGFWAMLAGLLFLQRDLGMFVVLSVTLLVMLFAGTGRIGYLLLGALAASGLGYLILDLFAHGQRRIDAWLSPFQDPTGNSWQILQGLSGMYAGGLWGEGFGQGNPQYTPIAQSDFIYAVIGEELGLVGCTLLVVCFLVFFGRGLRIADQTRSTFGRLVCVGLTTVLAIQTFLNLGGVTKFVPLTGITLPFISQGGSSLVTAFISLGLILAVSDGGDERQQKGQEAKRGHRVRSKATIR